MDLDLFSRTNFLISGYDTLYSLQELLHDGILPTGGSPLLGLASGAELSENWETYSASDNEKYVLSISLLLN